MALVLGGLCAWLLAAGCVRDVPVHIRLNDDVEIPARRAVVFFVDGMDVHVMHEMAARGQLPHIRRRFIQGGVGVDRAVAGLPSVTYPNCNSLITGQFAGHHDIMGNFWFDRRSLIARDYMTYATYRTVNGHLHVPTIFDLLGERFTLNIQGHSRQGATHTIDNDQLFAWAWMTKRYIDADRHVGSSFEEAARVANRAKRWPELITTYYPGVDEVGHRFGPGSRAYGEALMNIDHVVGHVTDALDEAGLGEDTVYCLIADHGMSPVEASRRLDLIGWLKASRRMRVRTEPINLIGYADRYDLLDGYDAVASVDAGRVAMIHLRGERGWPYRPSVEEVGRWVDTQPRVVDLPAVDFVMMRAGADAVRVLSKRGSMVVQRQTAPQGYPAYRVVDYEGDVLRCAEDSALTRFIGQGWHASRDWLAATADAAYPDFVAQVAEMFDSWRTGDVVVTAAPGANLYDREVGGHGSCQRRDMLIPMYFAGRGLPHGVCIDHGRLVDFVPTMLDLLGEGERARSVHGLDGVSLAEQLAAAVRPCESP